MDCKLLAIMRLTGNHKQILRKGIIGAYPSQEELVRVLAEKMDINFDTISRGNTYNDRVFYLIRDLQAQEKIKDFIKVIIEDKPNSPFLEEIKRIFPDNIDISPITPIQKYWFQILASFILILLIGFGFSLPKISTLFNNRGYENYKHRDWGKAKENYQRALLFDHRNAEAHFNLGLLYEELQNLDAARTYYKSAIEGGIAPAINNLARLEILQKDYKTAVSLLLKASLAQNLDPKTKHAVLKNLGWARLMQKNYPDAKAKLEEAISLDIPQNKLERYEIAASHCLLAQVMEAQDDKEGALKEWKTCNQYATITIPEQDEWVKIAQKRLLPKD
ncbi:MAG: hypothetical protein RLZZ148_1036 [Cyanobacteriota bacterium]|jgi:hypothetical protein